MPKPYEALNPAILRRCFLEFAGAERYRKFVRSLGLTPDEDSKPARLRHWQEVLWTQFAESYPNAPMEMDLIRKSVMWCYVHDVPLESATGVDLSNVRYSAELESVLIDQCPFACCHLNCSDCVQVLNLWVASHPDECRLLRRRTTLDEYLSTLSIPFDRSFEKFERASRMVIADDMLDTDELWVWDNGRGQTGLAVVRDGNMKISWSCPVDLSTRQKTQNKTE